MSSIISGSQAILDRERFEALWNRCSAMNDTAGSTPVWQNLIQRYGEHHRHYHNNRHLAFCLQQLDLSTPLAGDVDAIEMAIWFHDVVYEPMAKDNEAKSAALFKIVSKSYFTQHFVGTVSRIIVATRHNNAPENESEARMLDIDLSSLGLPWEHFSQDSNDLRAELRGVPDANFYSQKLKFLNALLTRPRIYFTEFFFIRYEEMARRNIARYATWLEGQQGYR